MMSYIMGSVVSLFCVGVGIFTLVKARELGETIYHKSGNIFNIRFWVWSYRFAAICVFGIIIYMIYLMFFS